MEFKARLAHLKLTTIEIYYAALCSYLVVAFAVKVSLVTFIMRVFPQDYVRKGGLALIGFMTLFTISGELALAFQCKPVRAFWDKTITTATCFSTDTMFGITMYQGVVMFVCDVIIVGLPILPIWGLQMPVKRRLSVVFLFSFGILASAAALVRFSTLAYTKDSVDITCTYSHSLPHLPCMPVIDPDDPIFDTDSASTSLIWMEIEFNIGLLAGSLSSVRQLFKIRSIFSSHERSTGPDSKLASGNYELRKKAPWKDRGIMKTSELHTRVDELVRPESQERIVPIYGQGDSVRTDVSGRY